MKEKFQKLVESPIGKKIDWFCNSVWYILAYGIVVTLSHAFNLPVIGAALLTVLLSLSFVFCKNSFTLVPFFLMCSFVLSVDTKPNTGYFNSPLKITVLCLLFATLVVMLVFNLIYYGKWRKIFKRAYLSVSVALITGALVVGGIWTSLRSWTGVGMALAIGACIFLPYSLLFNCGEYKGRKTIEYFAWALIIAAVVIFEAVIQQYIIHGLSLSYHPKNLLEFGHTVSNSAAVIVLMALPMTFYMVYKYKHGFAFLFAVALDLITIFLTYSRATLLVAVVGTAIVAIVLCFKKKNGRLAYRISFGIACAIVLVIAIIFRDTIINQIKGLVGSNFWSGSGRTGLWGEGFELWKNNPIFGIGLWYLPQVQAPLHFYHSFHCTPLTYLYCAGILGLAAYCYHRYKTVRSFFSAKLTVERIFVALSVLTLLINSLLDIYMTEPLHLLYYGVMLALIECDVRAIKTNCAVKPVQIHLNENADNISGDKKDNSEQNNLTNEVNNDGMQS